MDELDRFQQLLVMNWQKKYYQLSDVVIDSLVGLDLMDTLVVLAQVRKKGLGVSG